MNKHEIKIGVLGKIIEGEYKNWFLLIKEDFEESSGYLILISRDQKMAKDVEGYDCWAENINEIEKILETFGKIVWLNE